MAEHSVRTGLPVAIAGRRTGTLKRALLAAILASVVLAAPAAAGHNGYVPPDNQFAFGGGAAMQGTNCTVFGSPYREQMLNAYAGYTPGKKVGEVWWARLEVYKTGNNCGGAETFNTSIGVPDSHYAISNEYPVKCEFRNVSAGGEWGDITGQQINSPYGSFTPCTRDSASNGMTLVQGGAYRITIPVVSRRPMAGAGAANDKLTGTIDGATTDGNSGASGNQPGYPEVFVNVAENPPVVEYPNPSTTAITETGARSMATLYSFYRPGTIHMEIGETTAYGTVGFSAPATSNDYGYALDHTWTGLQPGRTYHWRVRFVDSQGRTYVGPDQEFTTAGSSGGGAGGGTDPGGGSAPSGGGTVDPVGGTDPGSGLSGPVDGDTGGDTTISAECAKARQLVKAAKKKLRQAEGKKAKAKAKAKLKKAKRNAEEACA